MPGPWQPCGLQGTHPHVGVVPMDWSQFLRHHGLDSTTQPRYEHLVARDQDQSSQTADLTAAGALRAQLRAATGPARDAALSGGHRAPPLPSRSP